MSTTLLEPTRSSSPARDHAAAPTVPSARARVVGWVLTGFAALFLTFDAGIKLAGARAAVDGTVGLGYQPHHVTIIGAIAAVCLVLYLIPRTAPIGALLWTAYFGGAVASNLRLDLPLVSHTLFPIYVAALVWGGLYLRDERVRALVRPAR